MLRIAAFQRNDAVGQKASDEQVSKLCHLSLLSQCLNVGEATTTKVASKPVTLTLAEPVATSVIGFRTGGDLDYHFSSL
ncbi:MAG: hypothetical protein KGQ51_06230 [Planctomycetes bacterium]|nr:hypothetical protein [Planctomycetota bacterium]